jgi:hypothetical protein
VALPVDIITSLNIHANNYMWQQWVNAILGIAIIATPFLALSATALTWTLVVAGVAVAILSVWSAMKEESVEYHQYKLQHSH